MTLNEPPIVAALVVVHRRGPWLAAGAAGLQANTTYRYRASVSPKNSHIFSWVQRRAPESERDDDDFDERQQARRAMGE